MLGTSVRNWVGRRTPAQQVAIAVAVITSIGSILGATVQTAPSFLTAFGNWQYRDPSAPSSQPVIVEGVEIGQAEPFIADVYPRRITHPGSSIDSISRKIDLPPGEHAVGGQELISLTLGSNSTSPVIIEDIQVTKACQAPAAADETLFFAPNGSLKRVNHGIYYNLNDPGPVAEKILKNGSLGSPYFVNHPVTLKPGQAHTFTIYVSSSRLFCQFIFYVKVATSLGSRSIKVSSDGRPFLVTGLIHKRGQDCIDFPRYSSLYTSNPNGPPLHWQRASPGIRELRTGCVSTSGAVHPG